MCSREDHEHLGHWSDADAHVRAIERGRVATLTAEDYILADPVEAVRAGITDPPFWAVIHPSGRVNLVHGRPSELELQRTVDGYVTSLTHRAESGMVALANDDGGHMPDNIPASAFLRVPAVYRGPIVLIGEPDGGGYRALPAEVRMRLVRELIEA